MFPLKKCIAVHDLSGIGRCSLTVVMPVLGAMGVTCYVLPAAYLSTHTGYPGFTFHDMTNVLRPALSHWKSLDVDVDAVYSGFLGSVEQMDIVAECIETFRRPGFQAIVDPVMGDHGKPYKTYTPEMCARMKSLIEHADIITPNFTECCLLLGKDYADVPRDEDGVRAWLRALSGDGKRAVVITGVRLATLGDAVVSCAYLTKEGEIGFISYPFSGGEYHGTGDLFSSVLTGCLLQGNTLSDAVSRAAGFVQLCAAYTFEKNTSFHEGVHFESLLGHIVAPIPGK